MKILAIFGDFKLNLCVTIVSAEGASENFRVFYKGTTCDVIVSKFQGVHWHPLLTPMRIDITLA